MSTVDKIVILLDGFTRTEASTALEIFAEAGGEASRVVAAPVTDVLCSWNTRKAVEETAAGNWPGGLPRNGVQRAVLIAGADNTATLTLMRCFKSVMPAGSDAAFAMVTETGLGWTVGEYLAHITAEHEFMKTAKPSENPDMQPV